MAKNTQIKSRPLGLVDKNRRMVRGFSATFLMITVGAISLNVNMIQSVIGRAKGRQYRSKPVRQAVPSVAHLANQLWGVDGSRENAPPSAQLDETERKTA